MEVAAHLGCEGIILPELAVAAVRRAEGLAADALHIGLDGLLLEVKLGLGDDAHGRVEVENVQNGLVQADDHGCLQRLVRIARVYYTPPL